MERAVSGRLLLKQEDSFKCGHCRKRFTVMSAQQWVVDDSGREHCKLIYPTREGHPSTACEAVRGNGAEYQRHHCCNDCYVPASYNPDDGISY